MKNFFANPVQTIGYLGILSIIGLIAIGILASVTIIEDGAVVDGIVNILAAVLYTAIGAKSALAQYKPSSDNTEQNNIKK